MSFDFGEDRLRGRGSLPATSVSYTHLDVYKRQELSRPIVFGEDRLRERGSLPTTFF